MGKINKSWYTSTTDEWATPQAFFDSLNATHHFTLDPCATPSNAKCQKYYTRADDGRTKDWTGEVVFCNPPYGKEISSWVKKCYDEAQKGVKIALLIPARCDTSYFHSYIIGGKARLEFVRGRLHFNDGKQGAPFPSVVAYFNL